MIPVILFLGICFAGVGDCSDDSNVQYDVIDYLEFEQRIGFINSNDVTDFFSGTSDNLIDVNGENIIPIYDNDGKLAFEIEIHQDRPDVNSHQVPMSGQCRNQPSICFMDQLPVIYTIHEKSNYKLVNDGLVGYHPIDVNSRVYKVQNIDDGIRIWMDVYEVMPFTTKNHHMMPLQWLNLYYEVMEEIPSINYKKVINLVKEDGLQKEFADAVFDTPILTANSMNDTKPISRVYLCNNYTGLQTAETCALHSKKHFEFKSDESIIEEKLDRIIELLELNADSQCLQLGALTGNSYYECRERWGLN